MIFDSSYNGVQDSFQCNHQFVVYFFSTDRFAPEARKLRALDFHSSI